MSLNPCPHYSVLALAAAKACSIELWAGDYFLMPAWEYQLQLCYLGSELLALAEASGDSRQKPVLCQRKDWGKVQPLLSLMPSEQTVYLANGNVLTL